MLLTVLICTRNGAGLLPATLEALRAQTGMEAVDWEIVLVDNASTDLTPKVFAAFAKSNPGLPCRYVEEPGAGHGLVYRRGFAEARGAWICMVDDDNVLSPDYLREGLAFAQRASSDVGAFGGNSRARLDGPAPAYWEGFSNCLAIWQGSGPDRNIGAERLFTAGLFLRAAALRPLLAERWVLPGRSRDWPFGGVDSEIYQKLHRAGWSYWYVGCLSFDHVLSSRRTSLPALLKLRRHQGGINVFLQLAYLPAGKSLVIEAARLYFYDGWLKFLARLFLFCVTPGSKRWWQLSEAAMRWGYILYFFLGLRRFASQRHLLTGGVRQASAR